MASSVAAVIKYRSLVAGPIDHAPRLENLNENPSAVTDSHIIVTASLGDCSSDLVNGVYLIRSAFKTPTEIRSD
jgi:hypothetical protein